MQLERKLQEREEALKRGENPPAMNYKLLPIYVVSLLNFVFLELGRLKAGGNEPGKCQTAVERLAWSLKYMHVLDGRPETFEDDVLKQLYNSSEFANLSVEQQLEYEEKMFNWLDVNGIKEYAQATGLTPEQVQAL